MLPFISELRLQYQFIAHRNKAHYRSLFIRACGRAGIDEFKSNANCSDNPTVKIQAQADRSGRTLLGDFPMRDWLLILSPLALTFYFVVNPDQFAGPMGWLASVLPR
jgi:hypothetical protein